MNGDWLSDRMPQRWTPHFADLAHEYTARHQALGDPVQLLLVDEADRLSTASLEQLRDLFDHGNFALVLIGMPGLEIRLARYAQPYSRVGFVHEFRSSNATEIRRLLESRWTPAGVELPDAAPFNEEVIATVVRVTGGNFRLLHRLPAQVKRLLDINQLERVTCAVIEAARESLVIGQV